MNVGLDLAEKIPIKDNELDHMHIEINSKTLFLSGVSEAELVDIVNKCKNKLSTDCFDIDMTLIKKIIYSISKPLTYICNLSFQTGSFPKKYENCEGNPTIYKWKQTYLHKL